MCVCIFCVDGRSMYLYIVLGGYAHLRCTQCSIMLHLIDISFLPCICLWQILQIETRLCVVLGPGFVSTSPSFMRSSSHPAGPHGRLAPKNGKPGPYCGARGFDTLCTAVCRLCRWESTKHPKLIHCMIVNIKHTIPGLQKTCPIHQLLSETVCNLSHIIIIIIIIMYFYSASIQLPAQERFYE